jgi:release factor glutamine methyltransferase
MPVCFPFPAPGTPGTVLTRFRDLRLLTPPGVFAPRPDAAMLLDAAAERLRGEVLDVCTGSGVLAISAARLGVRVTAVDLSRRAVWATRINARMNGVKVEAVRGDLFCPLAGRRFDVILSNPPYIPVPPRARRKVGSHAWDAGGDGRLVLDPLCRGAVHHLNPGGEALIVHSSLAWVERTLELLSDAGLEAGVVFSHDGPLGPIGQARAGYLRDIGVLDDDMVERMVVVRGRRPMTSYFPKRPATAREDAPIRVLR